MKTRLQEKLQKQSNASTQSQRTRSGNGRNKKNESGQLAFNPQKQQNLNQKIGSSKVQAFKRNYISEDPHDWPGWSNNRANSSQQFHQISTNQLPGVVFFGRNQLVNYDYIHRQDGYTYFYPIQKCHLETHKQLSENDVKRADYRCKKYKMVSDIAIPLIERRNAEISKQLEEREKNNPFWRLK